jgi:WD40 repeat protein
VISVRHLVLLLILIILATAAAPTPGQNAPLAAPVTKKGAIFRVPDSYTLDVALTADGKLLARAGTDKTVDLWDVASGKKLHTLKGHTVPILKVAFSPDGKTLASITGSWLPNDVLGEVKLWDVATGKERVSLQGHPERGSCLAFSPDGKTLASAAGNVKLWDVETGKEKLEIRVGASSLAFSPDGKTLATGAGGSVILWDVTMISAMWSLGETQNELGLAVQQWELATGKARAAFWAPYKGCVNNVGSHNAGVYFASLSADGKTVAWGGAEEQDKKITGTAHVWDVQALATSPPKLP